MIVKPAARAQYGQLNYSEGGTPDFFAEWEGHLVASAPHMNAGRVYEMTDVCPPNANGQCGARGGLMPTRDMYYGVFRALTFGGFGIPTYLSNPDLTNWSGDAPVALQPTTANPPPWVKNVGKGYNIF